MNTPTIGPPTKPNMIKAACNTPAPSFEVRKAIPIQSKPKNTARPVS